MKALLLAVALALASVAAHAADTLPTDYNPAGNGLQMSSGKYATKGASGVLCSIASANFNTTADQACSIASSVTAYHVSKIIVTNCSTSLTLAVGGFYTAASKGGVALVANTQVYSTLTAAGVGLEPVIVAAGLSAGTSYRLTAATLYLSLTTAQGGAATCAVYIVGDDLTP